LKICVLGFGSWGTSISNLLAMKGYDIVSWTKDERIIESLRWHENPYYFPGKILSEKIQITNSLKTAISTADHIVTAIPEYFEQKRPRARKNETTFTEKSYHQSWKGNQPIEKTAIY